MDSRHILYFTPERGADEPARPQTKDASIEAMASRALHELPAPFILVSFSLGGYVARKIARLAPEHVQALVLIVTAARASGVSQGGAPVLVQSRFTGLSRRIIELSLHPEHISDATVKCIRAT